MVVPMDARMMSKILPCTYLDDRILLRDCVLFHSNLLLDIAVPCSRLDRSQTDRCLEGAAGPCIGRDSMGSASSCDFVDLVCMALS